jgi:hypothetical protein
MIQTYLEPNHLSGRELAGKLGGGRVNAESHPDGYEPHQL